MKSLLTTFLTLLVIFPLRAQTLTPEQAREDVQFLKKKLDRLHPGVGYYLSQPDFDRLYDSLSNRLTQPVDYQTFFREVTPLIAGLKDGHTSLHHRRNRNSKNNRTLPFFLRQAGDRYYISHNLSDDSTLVRGTELLRIDGQTVVDLHRLLQDTDRSGSDGDNRTGRRFRSLANFPGYYTDWFGSRDSVLITYRLPADTSQRTRWLHCETGSVLEANLKKRYRKEINSSPNLSVRMVDSLDRTAVLRISTFSSSPVDLATGKFSRRLKRAFRQIQEKEVRNLVVDVRSNGGGVVVNAARLLQYWMPGPFRVMERETMKHDVRQAFVKWYNPFSWAVFPIFYKPDTTGGYTERFTARPYRPRKKYRYDGKLYFLVNGASYSATATVLVHTLNAGLGTFVGEACGGAYWGDFAGQFKTVILPNSGLRVTIPLKRLAHAVDPKNANGFTVEPDFPIERTYDDILEGRDYAMQYTFWLIKRGKVASRVEKNLVGTVATP
ncbi:S41 family peptidase [Larkinella soli]|uniref:S41 family peptidase n=1 Tax=Larkinella soli TaxID=1770527 RepID=UPI000FFB71C0|nr:S41 family peptidase [Larkinella soli]